MPESYPRVPLGEVLVQDTLYYDQPEPRLYPKLSVKLYGKGAIPDAPAHGAELKMKRHQLARPGQVIVSEIWAKKGAIGIVPPEGEGALCTSHFYLFDIREDRADSNYIGWLFAGNYLEPQLADEARGSTGYASVRPRQFLDLEVPLPPLAEQRRVVARVEAVAYKVEAARRLLAAQEEDAQALLLSVFQQIVADAPYRPMDEVAPLVRRPVTVGLTTHYGEIGLRSFGKGVFHKPEVDGVEIGRKRVFWIREGDLLFSNVFAWEGAIAVAGPEDDGRIGSHRFITCVPDPDLATAPFLCFYFLTSEGLDHIREASPGGAGRNRTLGLRALAKIPVPLPPLRKQREFDALQSQVRRFTERQVGTHEDLDALLPSVLDRTFRGAL